MAIRTVVTNGFSNGTFSGSIALVVTDGFAIGETPIPPDKIIDGVITLAPRRTLVVLPFRRTLIEVSKR
jgi:hypothetical protein